MNSIEKDEGRKKNEKGGKRKMKIGNKKIERKEEIEGSNEDISRERKWKKKKVIKSGDIDKKQRSSKKEYNKKEKIMKGIERDRSNLRKMEDLRMNIVVEGVVGIERKKGERKKMKG